MPNEATEIYLDSVVDNQGKLFDFIAHEHPDKDTIDFIYSYMKSKTRKCADEGKAYVCTMDASELWDYFISTENYRLKPGKALAGFVPNWIGEFYAFYQWFYDIPSAEVVDRVPVEYLVGAYPGLHDLELDLAVKKAGV